MMVLPESPTILDSLAPGAPQMDSQVAEQLVVEFYSKERWIRQGAMTGFAALETHLRWLRVAWRHRLRRWDCGQGGTAAVDRPLDHHRSDVI